MIYKPNPALKASDTLTRLFRSLARPAVAGQHRGLTSAALLATMLTGCNTSEPPGEPLPAPPGGAYRVYMTTYESGYADKPFRLWVSTRSDATPDHLLYSEQCADVTLVQAAREVEIFFGHIVLREFGAGASEPTPVLLCDLRHPVCAELLTKRKSDGSIVNEVCSFKQGDTALEAPPSNSSLESSRDR
jgi:hypothetical protein